MILHIAFLVLVIMTPLLRHLASVTAGTLVIAAIWATIVASFYEHTPSVAPSSILLTHFLAAILLDGIDLATASREQVR